MPAILTVAASTISLSMATATGLSISSSDNTIRGLQIVDFPANGILLHGGAQRNVIGGDRSAGGVGRSADRRRGEGGGELKKSPVSSLQSPVRAGAFWLMTGD